MLKWYRFWFFLIIFILNGNALASPIIIDDTTRHIQLHTEAEMLLDTNNAYTITDMISHADRIPFSVDISPFGSTYDQTLWLKYDVESHTQETRYWIVEFFPPWLSHIDLYQVDQNNQLIATQSYNGKTAFDQREVHYRNPVIRIRIPGNTTQTIYIKISNNEGTIRYISLWNHAAFIENSTIEQLIWGIIIGIYIFLFLVSWWFEQAIKDGIYSAFAFYVFMCICINLQLTGWWQQLFFSSVNLSSFPFIAITYIWLTYSAANFFFKYLEVDKIKPFISKVFLNSLFAYSVIFTVILLTGYEYKMIRIHSAISAFIFIPVAIFILGKPAWKSHSDIKRVFFYISILFVVTYVFATLSQLGYFKRGYFTTYSITVTSTFVFLFIFYSLIKKYKNLREEKEKMDMELLKLTKDSEYYLEDQVAIKTKNLVEIKKELELSLEKERKAYADQKHFISIVSHELKSPLKVIRSVIEKLMGNKEIVAAGMRPKLEKMHMATNRLSTLITDYLNNDRVDAFSQQVESQWISVYPLLEDAVLMAKLMSAKQTYIIDLKEYNYQIWADSDLLKLVLRTLTENAAKYTYPTTKIHLNVKKSENGWMISVKDNGPGIPENEKDRVFDRYYRGQAAVKQVGTGLGLSLAKHFIELQKGTLTLESGSGQGCLFTIYLPFPQTLIKE